MSALYLTPASIGDLTQFILTVTIAGYLLYLSRRFWWERKPVLQTLLLAVAFTSFAGVALLLFFNVSLYPDLRFYTMPLESIALALFLTFLLQFAYRFPAPITSQKREAQIVLGLTLLDLLWEAGIAIHRYQSLAQGIVRFRPPVADIPLVASFLWVAIVFLRQAAHASSGEEPSSVWRALWKPRGPAARAARALALLSILSLGLEMADLLRSCYFFPSNTAELIQSLGILFALSAFALVYLNYLPEKTSFMVKLVGITLVTILAVLGSVGWIVSPVYVAAYRNDNFVADKQTLRFTPNRQGGYDVAVVPFRFENDLGVEISLDHLQPVGLAFDFPFYEQMWRKVHLDENGAVSFGQALDWHDVRYRYGRLPAIFPLAVSLAPADSPAGGLFAKNRANELLVTWNQLPAAQDRETRYTFQLALYPGGEFDITYNGLPARQTYTVYDWRAAPWLTGAVPGSIALRPDLIHLTADLPYAGGRGGIIEDNYLDFRRYLHQLLLPLAYLIIGSILFMIMIFPMFFYLNLVKPLNSLLAGVRQINTGDIEVTMPVSYHDEIGFLTQSFNDMTARLQRRTLSERQRAADLEALEGVSTALQRATTSADMIPILVEQTVKALGVEVSALLLLEDTGLVVAGLHGLPQTLQGHFLPLEGIPCWPALRAGKSVASDPPGTKVCTACTLCQTLAHGRKVRAAVPLQSANQTLGLLQIAFDRPNRFGERHRLLLTAIAEMGGNALQRARTMEMLEQVVESRTHELTTLYEVTRATTQHIDLQTILKQVLEQAVAVIDGNAGFIHLLNEESRILQTAVQYGTAPLPGRGRADRRIESSPLGADSDSLNVWNNVVARDETLIVRDLQVSETLRAFYIGVPIHAKGRILGVLSLFAEANRNFSVEDIALLSGIADHLGAAVENARLHRRAEETAVQEERRRLARDLHDSVTQSIHSLALSADTAGYLLQQRRFPSLEDSLDRLGESARQALKEMRLLLYELRLAPLEQMDLVEVLQTRLEAVEQRAGVEARLVMDGPADWSSAWEEDLYCIAMEALNNALRHARATQVSVHLQGGRSRVILEVADNGRGFDPQQHAAGGIGLRSMTERARRLGGELVVDSSPGEGTRVRVRLRDP
ncbi:MAG: GAF domain-containing protein [Chloroflexi bacterium]|nr:GAF domain-containing protein [Chloroflexota bacterium]